MAPALSLPPRRLVAAGALVLVAGAAGTALRDAALTWWPAATAPSASWPAIIPWTLTIINTIGVVVAVRLLRTFLRAHDPNNPWRLLWITGFLGGFTSYSSLVAAWAVAWHRSVIAGLVEATLSVALGVLAAEVSLRWRSHR